MLIKTFTKHLTGCSGWTPLLIPSFTQLWIHYLDATTNVCCADGTLVDNKTITSENKNTHKKYVLSNIGVPVVVVARIGVSFGGKSIPTGGMVISKTPQLAMNSLHQRKGRSKVVGINRTTTKKSQVFGGCSKMAVFSSVCGVRRVGYILDAAQSRPSNFKRSPEWTSVKLCLHVRVSVSVSVKIFGFPVIDMGCPHVRVSVSVSVSVKVNGPCSHSVGEIASHGHTQGDCPQGDSPLHTWPLNAFSHIALRTYIDTPCRHGHGHAHMYIDTALCFRYFAIWRKPYIAFE